MKLFKLTNTKIMTTTKRIRNLMLMTMLVTSMASIAVFAQQTMYEKGQSQLDSKSYKAAQKTFRQLAKEKGANQDAALYWLAYAQFKGKQDKNALKTIAKLAREHQQSKWLDDAQALKVEIQDKGGKAAVDIDNEEMKLYALDSLMNSPSEKSLNILKNIVASNHSERVKKRALFVLSQRDDPEAFALIAGLANDSSNVSLQEEAIQVLGISATSGALASLKALYQSTDNERVKLKIIESYMIADQSELLLGLAESESNPRLKSELIQMVGIMSNADALMGMYRNPEFKEYRREILEGLAIGDSASELYEVITSEQDHELVVDAIEKLGMTDSSKSAEYLTTIYRDNDDRDIRSAVLQAMMIQSNVKELINIVKVESDTRLKREALEYLSIIDSDEALEYFENVLQDLGAQQ